MITNDARYRYATKRWQHWYSEMERLRAEMYTTSLRGDTTRHHTLTQEWLRASRRYTYWYRRSSDAFERARLLVP